MGFRVLVLEAGLRGYMDGEGYKKCADVWKYTFCKVLLGNKDKKLHLILKNWCWSDVLSVKVLSVQTILLSTNKIVDGLLK